MIKDRYLVINAHFFPWPMPIFDIFFVVQSLMSKAIMSASIIRHPNIIAFSWKHKGMSFILCINDPLNHINSKSMLQDDRWPHFSWNILLCFIYWTWNTSNCNDISIFSRDLMFFISETMFGHKLFHCQEWVTIILKLALIKILL